MDVRYINPFIGAIQNLFKTMLETEVLVGSPSLKDKGERSADISALIGFSGDAAGIVALCFSNQVAAKVASKFADAEVTVDEPDLGDALGELANMVAGQAKAKMDGLNITITLPMVVAGEKLRTLKTDHLPVLTLPCDCALGRFSVDVSFLIKNKPKPQTVTTATAIKA